MVVVYAVGASGAWERCAELRLGVGGLGRLLAGVSWGIPGGWGL